MRLFISASWTGCRSDQSRGLLKATSLIAQTTLRSVLGQAPLDDLLSQRESINQKLQEIIDRQGAVGRQSHRRRMKDVALPDR